MIKKIILCVVVLCIGFYALAGGKADTAVRVEDPESWKETVDINDKKSGKYNFYVTAGDLGGNIATAGPFNMFIDPLSDLPVTRITNPRINMRVPGNLNIVGTCIDDDAVEYVELVFDGDESNPVRAEGKDFWSYYLDTTTLSEGEHTVSVYGVDINGLKGNAETVTWHLDRKKPQSVVDNLSLGALVSGTVTLTGSVSDGNGIDLLWYSLDKGENYTLVPLKQVKKNTETKTFSIKIDTKKMSDGPAVCWFKAKDLQGSIGIYTFLLFIDNTKPEINVVYPETGTAVNGIFTVAGYAGDAVELAKLSWKFGKETGEFDLTLGNPWWVKELDIRGQKTKSVEFEITAIDTSGNKSTVVHKIPVDQEADLPVVTLQRPLASSFYSGSDIELSGFIADDDGVASVFYSIDGSPAVEISCDGSFQTELTGLADGKHTITVWAKDITGVEGPKVTVSDIITAGALPSATLESVSLNPAGAKKGGGESKPFVRGMEIHPESGSVINGSITSGSALREITWQFGSSAPTSLPIKTKEITGGETPLVIPVPANVSYGPVPLVITVTDIHERKTVVTELITCTNLAITRGEPEVVFSDVRIGSDGTVVLSQNSPLSGYFVGGNVVKARFSKESKIARIDLDGNLIKIYPVGVAGTENNLTVIVETDRGYTYSSREFSFVVKSTALAIDISDKSTRNGHEDILVAGTVRSDLPIGSSSWRLLSSGADKNGIASGTLDLGGNNAFSIRLSSDSIPIGGSVLEIEAVTDAEPVYSFVTIYKQPPTIEPTIGANGKPIPTRLDPPVITYLEAGNLYYFTNYSDQLVSHDFSVNGASVSETTHPSAGGVSPVATGFGVHAVSLRVTDASGKTTSSSYKYSVAAKPAAVKIDSVAGVAWSSGVQARIPFGGSKDAVLIASVNSSLPVASASAQFSGTDTVKGSIRKIDAQNYEVSFSLPASLIAERTPVLVSVETKDPSGVSVAEASGEFVVVRPKDASEIRSNEEFIWINPVVLADGRYLLDREGVLSGLYVGRPLAAVAFENPASAVSASIENGIVQITALEEGSYSVGSLVVTDVDGRKFSSPPVVILSDFAAPLLSVSSPVDGLWIQNSVKLTAAITETNKITAMEYSVDFGISWKPLTALDITLDLSSSADGLIPLQIRVTDEAGRVAYALRALQKDTVAPSLFTVVPSAGAKVNGEILLGFATIDAGKIVKVEYQREDPFANQASEAAASAKAEIPWIELPATRFVSTMVGTAEKPLGENMKFRLTDASGNSTTVSSWPFILDQETDLPIVEIHLPEENEVVTTDFVVSGVVYDDDRPAKIWYKIDDNPEVEVEAATGYSIPIALLSLTDNEHTVTVYAEDVYGVKGLPVTRKFRVSLEEPKAAVLKPEFYVTNKGVVEISGNASDKNGIGLVQISVDNGNTFNDAVGKEDWKYTFDTKIMSDGTHVVFVKVFDNYGIEGLYSSLINVDNTAPEISLELPMDGMRTVGPVFISGQTTDGIDLKSVQIRIKSLDGHIVPSDLALMDVQAEAILAKAVDLKDLNNGLYNIDVSGIDAAGNLTRVSRNVILDKTVTRNRVEILYPLNGQHVKGSFKVYGKLVATDPAETVTLLVDGTSVETNPVTGTEYYEFTLDSTKLAAGSHVITVKSDFGGTGTIESNSLTVNYESIGPWITIDNLVMGDFAFERPWLEGSMGYILSEEDQELLRNKKAKKEDRDAVLAKKVESVEISFDNGRTFTPVTYTAKNWKYRVETQDMAEGYHFMLVRSSMKDGVTAVTRTIVQIDKTAPVIRLISPGEGGRYNQTIEFSGLASDDITLSFVDYDLRKGDKAAYEVPGFIQGLYFDAHFWGASLYDIGLGLTFFDDNVKLQVQYGQFTEAQWKSFSKEPMRYGGDIFGAKLLANLLYLPISYFAGPDWSWLSASVALGANYSMFSKTQSGKAQILSAVLAQLEFPRVTLPKRKMFKTFSGYTEFQLWFIPTDVSSSEVSIETIVPHLTAGVRVNVF